jgi:DNA-binding XRE family transcriptional regulator
MQQLCLHNAPLALHYGNASGILVTHGGTVDTPLRSARLKTGQSQDQVAKALGIDQGHYCRIEHGQICPAPALARRIAAHFGDRITALEILDPAFYMQPGQAA